MDDRYMDVKNSVEKNIVERNMNQNQNRLNREIKEELYQQTLTSDISDFSPKKVEYLVGLLEMEEATDEQEMNEAQRKFEEFFRYQFRRKIQLNRMKKYRKRLAGAVAVLILLFVTADVTTKAVMDESLFHMVGRWKDQIAIRPAKENVETEIAGFEEEKTQYFNSNEELAELIGTDFLVCSWLPEKIELCEIGVKSVNDFPGIVWEYNDSSLEKHKIEIWRYKATDNDTAGIASCSGLNTYRVKIINEKKVIYYETEEGNLAGFEYNGWCYMIDGLLDENTLDLVIGGMVDYETLK